MSDVEPLTESVEHIESLVEPSITTVTTTFAAMQRTVDTVSADCRAISETLESLGDALQVVTQGAGQGQEWGGFGMIGLPIAGAMRAVKGVAAQYVKQHTGIPLSTWTDLVASSTTKFEEYLSQLDALVALSQKYHAPTGIQIDPHQAGEDREFLNDVRWHTQAWKQILSRVAQLGQLVDAILQVKLHSESTPPEPGAPEKPSGFSGSLQRRIKEVQTRTVEKSSDLQEWLLQPFFGIRDRVRQLPAQTDQLSHQVALLEVLLDLVIAQFQACTGEISPTEARIVGMRVATSVLLPELAQGLADARLSAQACETYVDRLDRAHNAGQVDDRAYAILAEEYRQSLERSRTRLATLEARADVWRRGGRAVLDACADWAKLQLDVLAARRLAEQTEASGDRRALLQREQARVDEARRLLATL